MSLEGFLYEHDAAVGQSAHGENGVAVALAINADDADKAEDEAVRLIADALLAGGIEPLETLDRRVVRWDLFEAEVSEPNYPDIVGAAEAASILNVSRQRVHQLLRENPRFPEPLYRLRGTGPLWVRSGIEAFSRRWERRPGRPPSAAATG